MNAAHYHLIVNHLPIFTTLIGIFILGWGMFKSSKPIKYIAFVLFIIGALGSYVAMETGESGEEIVEEVQGISHDAIHDHEEAAEISMWFTIIMGVLSVLALSASKLKIHFEKSLSAVLLVTALLALGSLTYTAYEGGKIRHTEAYAGQTGDQNSSPQYYQEDDDD